jgi:hypothetical protein
MIPTVTMTYYSANEDSAAISHALRNAVNANDQGVLENLEFFHFFR